MILIDQIGKVKTSENGQAKNLDVFKMSNFLF